MIIQLGALLGAIALTHASLRAGDDVGSALVQSALFGAVWGGLIGTGIHLIATGTLWTWALALFGIALTTLGVGA